MINNEKKIIFIHIPKNAGTAIEWALMTNKEKKQCEKMMGYEEWKMQNYNGEKLTRHAKVYEYKNSLKEKYNDYKKFAVVRNPYERMVSWYLYLKKLVEDNEKRWFDLQLGYLVDKEKNKQKLNDLMNYKPPKFNYTFKQFVSNHWKIAELVKLSVGFAGNYKELFDPQFNWVDDTVEIIRYENLKEEIKKIINVDLTLRNVSNHEQEYINYYTKQTADIVYNDYIEDFKIYNYEKL